MNLHMLPSEKDGKTSRHFHYHRLAIGTVSLFLALLAVFTAYFIRNELAESTRIAVYLGEHLVGYLEDKSILDKAADRLTMDIYRDTGVLYVFDHPFSWRIHPAGESTAMLDEQYCYDCLQAYSVKDFVLAYSLMWDGEYLCSMATEEEILDVLDDLVQQQEEETAEVFDQIQLANEIQIVNRYCAREDIVEEDEMLVLLSDKADYTYVDVVTAVQTIAYQTVYEQDEEHYPYYSVQDVEGENGEQLVEYALSYSEDGSLSSKVAISSQVTKAAVDARIVQGAKEYPEAGVTTGSIIWPLAISEVPYISSYFGNYRAAFDADGCHRGIDIPLVTDTPVYAADGGIVTHCGETESYGKAVIITHDNGLRTVYAHLNQINVTYEQEIHQGQLIGHSGNTGASTAPHLHFEVRLNNSPVNPFNYLPETP